MRDPKTNSTTITRCPGVSTRTKRSRWAKARWGWWLGVAFLSLLGVAGRAAAQTYSAKVYARDVQSTPQLEDTQVSYVRTERGCEFRLAFDPGTGTVRPIKEVNGDRGAPQRIASLQCQTPSFRATEAANGRQYEEQTAYFWSKVARDYAVRRLWLTPRGWPGSVQLATDGVQPNVLTKAGFNTACFPVGEKLWGCMKVWPHEGPKTHIKEGLASPDLVVHEFGHYAAGYVFGHMDPLGFSVPAALGDCAKLAFQEGAADMFKFLVLHDARFGKLAGADRFGPVSSTQTARWPTGCGNTYTEYDTAKPLIEAFLQTLWGADASKTVRVDWRRNLTQAGAPNDPDFANKTMAEAFAFALAFNRGQRVDVMANTILAWFTANEPGRAGQVWKIFAAHGFNPRKLGQACTSHGECVSSRCDNRPGAGCVWSDGFGASGDFCTTHQQCRSGNCALASGKISGVCSTTGRPLGQACTTHAECQSQRCDNRPGAGCVSQDGTGLTGGFCTTHQQCRSGYCAVASGKIAGTCATR